MSHQSHINSTTSLRLPKEWLERCLEETAPDLSRPALTQLKNRRDELRSHESQSLCAFAISYNPNAKSFEHWTKDFGMSETELLGSIEKDFCQGVSVQETTWKARDGGNKILLFGTKWQLVIRPQSGKNSGQRMAVVDGVKQLYIPTKQIQFQPSQVSFHAIWDEVPCSLQLWLDTYHAARSEYFETRDQTRELTTRLTQLHEQRKRVLSGAGRELRRGLSDEAVRGRNKIHRDIRRQYSALRVMMDLLKLRSEREAHEFEATVLSRESDAEDPSEASDGIDDSSTDVLRLQLPSRTADGIFDEDSLVELSTGVANRSKRARIRSMASVDGCLYVECDLAADTFPAGATVKLRTMSRFGMWAHQRAVRDLLEERVEGRWTDLAQLLLSPSTLSHPKVVPPERYFNEKLNEQQRKAVAGALSTSHAFCIQGPPGTGKTTVICELVEQMIGNGDRVLLVAPTHVAVDEVLRRIGSREGVRALRLAWDEGKVNEDVRKFTPTNIIDPFLQRANSIDSARRSRWIDQKEAIAEAIAQLEALREAQRTTDVTKDQWQKAERSKRKAEAALATEQPNLETRIRELHASIENAERVLDELREEVGSKQNDLVDQKSSATWFGTAVGLVGLGSIGVAKRELSRAQKRERAKTAECSSLRDETTRVEGRLDELRRGASDAVAKAAEEAQELETATQSQSLAEMTCRENPVIALDANDLATVERRVRQLQERRRRLESYHDLSLRFDALVERTKEENGDLDGLRRDLLAVTNLFCCTTTGIAGSPELRDLAFDALILDEASRVTDSEFLIGATRARRWILVGDEHQLPPYVEQNDEHFIHALSALHRSDAQKQPLEESVDKLGALWEEDEELHRFRRDSVLAFANRLLASSDWNQAYHSAYSEGIKYLRTEVDDPSRALLRAMRDNLVRSLFERVVIGCSPKMKVRLIEQRRMIEPIAAIVSQPVYRGDYRTASQEELAANGITPLTTQTFSTPITFLDTSLLGMRARDQLKRNSFVNPTEAQWVAEACRILDRELVQVGSPPVTVSVLTFYKAQARLIRERLFGRHTRGGARRFGCLRFSVIDAIDKIQGQESDIVFLSFCRTAGKRVSPRFGKWLQDLRRLNVACTRAHRALVFVGQRELLARLCSNQPAIDFYKHLNELFEMRADSMRVIRQFGGNQR